MGHFYYLVGYTFKIGHLQGNYFGNITVGLDAPRWGITSPEKVTNIITAELKGKGIEPISTSIIFVKDLF